MIQAHHDGYIEKAHGGSHESNDDKEGSNNSHHLLSTYSVLEPFARQFINILCSF